MDDEELISSIQCCFLESAQNYPLRRRPRKIAANLKFLTLHSLLELKRTLYEFRDSQKRLIEDAEQDCPDQLQSEETPEAIEPPDVTVKRFRVFVEAGIVDEKDFKLIVETRVAGRQVQDAARELGITIEAAWKRRKRAENSIRNNFGKFF